MIYTASLKGTQLQYFFDAKNAKVVLEKAQQLFDSEEISVTRTPSSLYETLRKQNYLIVIHNDNLDIPSAYYPLNEVEKRAT